MPPSREKLETYRDKRDFARSPEPQGEGNDWKKRDNPVFVIQQHDASSMHFDFRLEIDGVLVSWAVPKGPSTDPEDKRLAIRTEDHPMAYADFEGTIPKDEYGGGRVIVWDAGPFRNLKKNDGGEEIPLADCLENGQVEVWLEGRKIRGGYALINSKMGGVDKNWLLIKMKDEGADARRNPVSTQPKSVLSGRTIEDLGEPAEDDSA
jgi:DNA ligase D-like protein (predicted 3'-phosphoesterase)